MLPLHYRRNKIAKVYTDKHRRHNRVGNNLVAAFEEYTYTYVLKNKKNAFNELGMVYVSFETLYQSRV